jgi:4-amino-4-deoxy-L-arabinose transferase-like glycosyltransferase
MVESKNWWIWIAGICLTYFLAVGVDTMDEDASQYISMSREMKLTGSYLQVYESGKDYLDKPPFLFWINAVSMHVFGENNFAFKLPSILFAMLAVFCTYKLAQLYYEEDIARIAAFILAGSQALYLITNDIRTDTILMGWIALALWCLTKWYKDGGIYYFLLGCMAIGAGMMTKGPIALLVPAFAIGSQLLLQRRFNYLFKKEYALGILVILIMLIPMCIGLYQQFDLHPEKTMYGKQGTSGLKFFFWTQSFGRITGESVWDNGAPFGFLFENLLWGFLPWTLFMIIGILAGWIFIIRNRFHLKNHQEGLSIAGFTLTYCSLASSNYQLPHYIYVVLPLLAIMTAKLYHQFIRQKNIIITKAIACVQYFLLLMISVLPMLILIYVFPTDQSVIWLLSVLPIVTLTVFSFVFRKDHNRIIGLSILVIMTANAFLSTWFYPTLLSYQAGNVAGRIISKIEAAKNNFFMYRFDGSGRNIHFYGKQQAENISDINRLKKDIYVITREEGLSDIIHTKKGYQIIHQGEDYPVSQLTPEFLNIKTRSSATRKYYLVKINS